MLNFLKNFLNDKSGVTAIEYGLIAALIAVVIIASVRNAGSKVGLTFSRVAANM